MVKEFNSHERIISISGGCYLFWKAGSFWHMIHVPTVHPYDLRTVCPQVHINVSKPQLRPARPAYRRAAAVETRPSHPRGVLGVPLILILTTESRVFPLPPVKSPSNRSVATREKERTLMDDAICVRFAPDPRPGSLLSADPGE